MNQGGGPFLWLNKFSVIQGCKTLFFLAKFFKFNHEEHEAHKGNKGQRLRRKEKQ